MIGGNSNMVDPNLREIFDVRDNGATTKAW